MSEDEKSEDNYFEEEEPELADFEGPYVKKTHNYYEDTGFHELLNDPNVWPGDSIHVQPYNQMGREVLRVRHGKDGKKTTKTIQDYYGEYSDPESDFENERALRGFSAITRDEYVAPQEADMAYYPFKKIIREESITGEPQVIERPNKRANNATLDVFQGKIGKTNTEAMEKYLEQPITLRRRQVEGNPAVLAVFQGQVGKNNIDTMKKYMGYNNLGYGHKKSRRKYIKKSKRKSRKKYIKKSKRKSRKN